MESAYLRLLRSGELAQGVEHWISTDLAIGPTRIQIDRPTTAEEYRDVLDVAARLGLERLDRPPARMGGRW